MQRNAGGQRMRATLGGTVGRYIYNGDRILQETDDPHNELHRHITEGAAVGRSASGGASR
jgi:hypothetical protein